MKRKIKLSFENLERELDLLTPVGSASVLGGYSDNDPYLSDYERILNGTYNYVPGATYTNHGSHITVTYANGSSEVFIKPVDVGANTTANSTPFDDGTTPHPWNNDPNNPTGSGGYPGGGWGGYPWGGGGSSGSGGWGPGGSNHDGSNPHVDLFEHAYVYYCEYSQEEADYLFQHYQMDISLFDPNQLGDFGRSALEVAMNEKPTASEFQVVLNALASTYNITNGQYQLSKLALGLEGLGGALGRTNSVVGALLAFKDFFDFAKGNDYYDLAQGIIGLAASAPITDGRVKAALILLSVGMDFYELYHDQQTGGAPIWGGGTTVYGYATTDGHDTSRAYEYDTTTDYETTTIYSG